MATYLLRATDERMAQWKQAALEDGMKFSDWLRAAADSRLRSERDGSALPSQPEAGAPAVNAGRSGVPATIEVTPDWK